jgi:predicted nucleic acid-binding protein
MENAGSIPAFVLGGALIVAAAVHASCGYLLTEDLQEGQDLDGVIVVNPFRTDPNAFLS